MEDKEAIIQVALDYVEGWYQGNDLRMNQALSDKLVKRRILPTDEIWEVNKDWMIEATKDGKGKIEEPERGRKEVTVLDMTETIGSVRIISNEFVDYIHVVKVKGKWVIANVLWDYIENKSKI
jgi:hypothetical protein